MALRPLVTRDKGASDTVARDTRWRPRLGVCAGLRSRRLRSSCSSRCNGFLHVTCSVQNMPKIWTKLPMVACASARSLIGTADHCSARVRTRWHSLRFCGTFTGSQRTRNTQYHSVVCSRSILSSKSETVDTCISATANTNMAMDMRQSICCTLTVTMTHSVKVLQREQSDTWSHGHEWWSNDHRKNSVYLLSSCSVSKGHYLVQTVDYSDWDMDSEFQKFLKRSENVKVYTTVTLVNPRVLEKKKSSRTWEEGGRRSSSKDKVYVLQSQSCASSLVSDCFPWSCDLVRRPLLHRWTNDNVNVIASPELDVVT